MDKKLMKRLLTIGAAGLMISAIIFICLCIFTEEKNNAYLYEALGSIILSNLFSIIKRQYTQE